MHAAGVLLVLQPLTPFLQPSDVLSQGSHLGFHPHGLRAFI
jgi:hypothetical protein